MGAPGAAPLAGNSFVILSVAVVGILATSLLLLAYYLFLTRCGLASWRRDHDDVVTTTQHHHHIVYSTAPEPSRGLEEAAIRRIPTLRYRESKQLQAPQAQAASECAVCLSEFQEGERLRLLPPCLHLFHTDCIDAWLHATANCPLCRTAISGSACQPQPHVILNQIDIVNVLQADHVVIDIASPSRGETSNVAGVPATIVSMGDERIDPRRDELLDVQQPMRRSLSMDSCNDKHLYLALQKVLRHHHSHSASLGEDRKGESSTPAAAASSRAAGRLRRSFLSFSHSRSSRSAILPI
ncbi:RING-H2 finger protein ATL1-like [Aegilops tauschii subsp. strangulata]|uniref:RING-type E3 ubiquitin transferase n=2 Tax=Aegilops tauschii TaxID=37682 RepID=A0A453RLD3_AEGTS|nr:RING-H2 finger protein ATL16-like [Aegilops tauschii subsp. strangulata]